MKPSWYWLFAGIIAFAIAGTYITCEYNARYDPHTPDTTCKIITNSINWLTDFSNLEKLEHMAIDALVEGRVGKFKYTEGVFTIDGCSLSFIHKGKWIVVHNSNPESYSPDIAFKGDNCQFDKVEIHHQHKFKEWPVGTYNVCTYSGKFPDGIHGDELHTEVAMLDQMVILQRHFGFFVDLMHHHKSE